MENGLIGATVYAAQQREDYSERLKQRAAEVWTTLSKINVNNQVEKKNGHSYLSWAWAWGVLMQHYPDSRFHFHQTAEGGETFKQPDGSCEVRCTLDVNGVSRTMWLPVMDHRNNAIKNADARALNDAKMRCLVKTMALFGLGHYIYAGEDLPDTTPSVEPKEDAAPAVDPIDQLLTELNGAKSLAELKVAFTKASKYAKNRNDNELLTRFTTLKDDLKARLG